jgi:tetratricopeptide (TPR) repeat protein
MLVLFPGLSFAGETVEEFEMANKFYEDKDYASAIRMYESVLNQGLESAPLYFNLGNAYFKSGDLGHATLNYMRAKKLSPGDEDIRQNLEFARQFARVQMEGVELNPVNTFLLSLVGEYQLSFLAWISSALFIFFVILLIIRWGIGIVNPAVRVGLVLSLLLVVITLGMTTFKYRHDYLTRRAVIIAEESPVLTGPSDQSDIELDGAPGLIVEILDESGDYYSVLFENKRRGWISKELVAEI